MQVLYKSTRGKEQAVTASMAILKGLSEDGGLFVPESIPQLDVPMDKLAQMTYQETAYEVMSRFLTDFTEDELKSCHGRLCRCAGNEDHCILSEAWCQPDPGETDGNSEGCQHLCGRYYR